MEHDFLKALVIIFGVSACSVFVLHRFRIPSTVGFILAGLLIGPHGFGLITNTYEIEILAEVGVVLLLFTVGLEFSLKKLARIKNIIIFSGGGQVALTIVVTALATYAFSENLRVAVFYGFITSLSSTAIVLKTLSERGEMNTPHGNKMLGILIFQDLCIVPMILITPVLAGGSIEARSILLPLIKSLTLIVIAILSARWLFPKLLHQVVHTRSRELFLITIILACLGVALLTSEFGLSLSLGAFLSGLIISESEYSHQAFAEMAPFKESFLGLFFVSIGMLVDTSYIATNPLLVAGAITLLLALKVVGTIPPLLLSTASLRISIHASLGLAQIGEFSFILAETGKSAGLMPENMFQLFLAASVATMALTPFVHRLAPSISGGMSSIVPAFRREMESHEPDSKLLNHVIIIGFGLNGRNLAMTLKRAGIEYVTIEMNSATVRQERASGEPIHFGDATSQHVLDIIGSIKTARTLVIAISDPAASRKITSNARTMNPTLNIIVRTKYLSEVEDLVALGADEVIPEEFETSVEIFARVLSQFNIPRNIINTQIDEIRDNTYSVLRDHEIKTKPMSEQDALIESIGTCTYYVQSGNPHIGSTLRGMDIRNKTGATVIALKRDNTLITNPSPEKALKEGDILMMIGEKQQITSAISYIEGLQTET